MRLVILGVLGALGLAWLIVGQVIVGPSRAVETALVRRQMEEALKSPPVQTETTRQPFPHGEFRIVPRAEYDITGVVFSTRRYRWNLVDDFYKIAPEDLALGWGPLGDYRYKDILHIRQEDRFVKYGWKRGEPPFPKDVIVASLSNNHIVPATDAMAEALEDVRAGDIVHMTGALIDIYAPGNGVIHTSLTRTDSGPGACEILWLETLQIERR